jgi:3',5'-cyclic AMP phosphodiesterase CpdA
MADAPANLFAISDLHVGHQGNREVLEGIRPETDADWLLVAGDVGEFADDIEWALGVLAERFATVVWVPGNHELWTPPRDPVTLRGVERYQHLVDFCRRIGVVTPEDPYPVWTGAGGPIVVVPLFLLYDYTFRLPGFTSKDEAMAHAREVGVICTDEMLLHPDPYPSREAWCDARVRETERRLAELDPDIPTMLVNHFPLVRKPTDVLYYPDFALWCGTERTADWHVRHRADTVVYGHLHIPRTMWIDGVRFEEVSVGYPREWRKRDRVPGLRRILPSGARPA